MTSSTKKTISDYPDLVKEFFFARNGGFQPKDFSHGSNKKIWWVCSKNNTHIFDMVVGSRTGKQKQGCPYCSGKRVTPETSINATHPELARQWDYIKNFPLKPIEVSYGSKKGVWWICGKGHSFKSKVSDRALKSSGCPYCGGKLVLPETSLAALFPDIASLWHPLKNGKLKPEEVHPRSEKTAWFFCPKSELHDYKTRIADKTGPRTFGCPYCSGQRVGSDNNLKFKFPHLADEWHPTKNLPLTPEKITPGSGKSVWWVCNRGHEYKMRPSERTHLQRGCNQCSKYGFSQETRIYCEISSIFPDAKFREKVEGIEIDVFIPSIGIGIEYDGAYYHSQNTAKDQQKNSSLKLENIQLLRVREKPLPKLTKYDVCVETRTLTKPDMNKLMKSILEIDASKKAAIAHYCKNKNFVNDKDYLIYLSYFPSPFPENSLATKNPDVSKQWDKEKNAPLTPFNFTNGSGYDAFWICSKGHSHKSRIFSKVRNFKSSTQGCSFCSGIKTPYERSLEKNYPELSKEWHPTKNGNLVPANVTTNSNKLVWWCCKKCSGVEWQGIIEVRVKGFQRCPVCKPSQRNSIDTNEVRTLLKSGLTQKEVAKRLGISVMSVQRHK